MIPGIKQISISKVFIGRVKSECSFILFEIKSKNPNIVYNFKAKLNQKKIS